jgi:predicted RNA binding protein YcfA (HicA-like mRNA interferase family)
MKTVSGKQLARTLENQGWQLLRVHGSHHVFGKPGNPARLTVPVHGNRPLKRGLLAHLLKLAGLSEEQL